MENFYAQALWQMLKKGVKPKDVLVRLRASLKRQGREALLPKIGRAFEHIAAREGRKSIVRLSVARKKDERTARAAAKAFLKEMSVSPKELVVEQDENLIGGWRLEGREHLVDASFKKHLLSLYNRVTQ